MHQLGWAENDGVKGNFLNNVWSQSSRRYFFYRYPIAQYINVGRSLSSANWLKLHIYAFGDKDHEMSNWILAFSTSSDFANLHLRVSGKCKVALIFVLHHSSRKIYHILFAVVWRPLLLCAPRSQHRSSAIPQVALPSNCPNFGEFDKKIQTESVGFRSGEFEGHVSLAQNSKQFCSQHAIVDFDRGTGAQYCWITNPPRKCFLVHGIELSLKIAFWRTSRRRPSH